LLVCVVPFEAFVVVVLLVLQGVVAMAQTRIAAMKP